MGERKWPTIPKVVMCEFFDMCDATGLDTDFYIEYCERNIPVRVRDQNGKEVSVPARTMCPKWQELQTGPRSMSKQVYDIRIQNVKMNV